MEPPSLEQVETIIEFPLPLKASKWPDPSRELQFGKEKFLELMASNCMVVGSTGAFVTFGPVIIIIVLIINSISRSFFLLSRTNHDATIRATESKVANTISSNIAFSFSTTFHIITICFIVSKLLN